MTATVTPAPAHDDGLRAFQRRIAATPLLTAAEELELARRIADGDADARRRLVEANLRLVVHLARPLHHANGSLSLMELVQEGSLGLLRAAERFDHRRGLRFSTYAGWWIREALYRALNEHGRLVRLPSGVRDGVKRLRAAERDLEAALGRTPTTAELADALDAEPAEVAEMRAASLAPASLDAATDDEDAGGALVDRLVDERLPDADAGLQRAQREADVDRLLESLRPLERRCSSCATAWRAPRCAPRATPPASSAPRRPSCAWSRTSRCAGCARCRTREPCSRPERRPNTRRARRRQPSVDFRALSARNSTLGPRLVAHTPAGARANATMSAASRSAWVSGTPCGAPG
jgi:RNA polymerase primary sigma factor